MMRILLLSIRFLGNPGANCFNSQKEYGQPNNWKEAVEKQKLMRKAVCKPMLLWNQRGQCGKDQSCDNFKLIMGKNVYKRDAIKCLICA